MTTAPSSPGAPITDKRQLVEYLESGCKPPAAWRVGTEHEKFVFRRSDLRRVPYEGPDGIAVLLREMTRFGWKPIIEDGNAIALANDAQCAITLEPGGQFELSGAPLETVHQTCDEVHEHLRQVREVCDELGLGMLGLGFDPKWRREAIPFMPKVRYRIMRDYMPKKGRLGLDMMLRTCTVQANLDFGSEADMVKKFRVSLALQPVAVALFANSPFVEGQPSGFLSQRSLVWTDTDPDRCGTLPFVFEDGFGFERYVDYMLDVPMYFVYRNEHYIDASGQSFRDFIAGRLPALTNDVPRLGDWADHLTTAFPEVRLKTFLEMRGADGPPQHRRRGRDAFSRPALCDRRLGAHPGRRAPRRLPHPLGRQCRSGVLRLRLLTGRPISPARAPATAAGSRSSVCRCRAASRARPRDGSSQPRERGPTVTSSDHDPTR